MDELEALEGIKRGLADVEAGRVTPLRDFETGSEPNTAWRVALAHTAKAEPGAFTLG